MTSPETRPTGVTIAQREIYDMLVAIRNEDLPELKREISAELNPLKAEVSRLKSQLSAIWVTHGLVILAVGGILTDWIRK